jgi:hypothetical protein
MSEHFFLLIKAARCDCCKSQGTLKERVQWRGEMKHFCDQHCLLRFYCQQNEPNMTTQKGPENLHYGMSCGHLKAFYILKIKNRKHWLI